MMVSSFVENAASFFTDRLFRGKALGLLFALLGSVGPVLAAPEFVSHTLSNGPTVVLVEEHWHPLVALDICYRAGSRYDPSGKQGLAHLVERLTFRSSSSLGKKQKHLSAPLEQAAATTNQDISCYRHTLLRKELENILAAEAARMTALQVSAADLVQEKAIVLKERQQLVEGNTWRNFLEEVDSVAYRLHPYRFPTAGWPETLAQITRNDVQRHFEAYYSPTNAILVAVGDFHPHQLLTYIEATFGQVPARAPLSPSPAIEPVHRGERRLLFAPQATPRMVFAYHVPAFQSPDTAALEVLASLLAGGDQSYLPILLSQYHLAEDVRIEYSPLNQDPGLFSINLALGPRVNFPLTEKVIDEVLWSLREGKLNPKELERAKKRLLLRWYLDRSIRPRAARVAQYAVLAALSQLQDYQENIRAVTAGDIRRILTTYFLPGNRVIGIMGAAHQGEVYLHRGDAP